MGTGIHKIHKGVLIKGNLNGSTVLDIQGTQGQLFSVTDNLVGLLHGVNDISGIPIFSVYSDDVVKMGTYNAEAIVVSGSTAIVKNLTVTGNLVGISSGAFISDTAPETPSSGMLWFNPVYGTLLTYVDSSWVAAARDGMDGAKGNDAIITFGTTADTSCQGNDARLSDTRVPTDSSVTYNKLSNGFTTSIIDNDGSFDFSAAGIIVTNITGTTTISFTNLQRNKTLKMKIINTNLPTINFPAYCTLLAGSQTIQNTNGTFYLYFDCWESTGGSESVLYSIMKGA